MGDFSSRYRIVAAVGKAPYIQVVARAKKPQFDPIASAIKSSVYLLLSASHGAVALAPFAHAYPGTGLEELVKRDVRAEAAERCYGANRRIGHRKEEIDLVHAHMLDLVKDRMSHRFTEAHLEQAA